jgi:hypothetical protein
MIRLIGTLAGLAWVVFMAWGAMREYQATPPDTGDRRALRDRLIRRFGLSKPKE